MFERFTTNARQTVTQAQEHARRLQHRRIGTEHLLLGLLGQPDTLSAQLLNEHGLTLERAEAAVLQALPGPNSPGGDLDAEALETIGIDLAAVRERIEASFGPGALDRAPSRNHRGVLASGRHIPFDAGAKKALELSLREALALKSKAIQDGHILLGLLREAEGLGARIISGSGIDVATLRTELERRLR
ncbi:Clp protease N-terminal domain-containing protein [Microtetraspora sp. NBRC 16547]|uniref:Clp protease N-terminal domain-containing protein n=1 Tax=Microtetraspora sp. NBRC 16547 TaxID=3030993 RepID=UPI0024A3979B|nr:Clp protease N-terminal domain-containing protein [Microtetraspora sp. NBRC 16547]GLW97704.1 Clp protease [Microtetraspora sp. NBRC 16547]